MSRRQMPGSGESGYTLAEVIVALAIGVMLLGAIYSAVVTGQRSSVAIERKIAAHQDARACLEIMSMEIQMASFNPNFASGIWKDPSNCASASSTQSNKGIQEATDTAVTVEMDLNENSIVGSGDANEIIRYAYNSTDQYITRATNCGSAQPFLGDDPAATDRPRTVRVVNGADTPVFRYYNGSGALLSPPVDIPSIRRIEITLVVETEDIDPNMGQRRRMIYTTSVIPRNHAISP
ncbi:MAG: PilW family protein [Syntrophales bacterium]